MRKLIKYTPIILAAMAVASCALYSSVWWGDVYPIVQQLYTAVPLVALLWYAIKNRHPVYLRIIYIGLLDLNLVNCMVFAFHIEHWMPYTVIVLLVTAALVVYYLMRKRNVTNKHPTS